jgi:hypothetical protein
MRSAKKNQSFILNLMALGCIKNPSGTIISSLVGFATPPATAAGRGCKPRPAQAVRLRIYSEA